MENEYPHDGVIPLDDPYWQTLDRDLTNEDYFRMTMTAEEYQEMLAEADRQDGIDHSSPWNEEVVTVEEDGVVYQFIEGEWVAEGQQPLGEVYYPDPLQDESWLAGVEQAEQGNYLDPL